MTDDGTPPTYHALSRSERDHLLAVAQLDGENPSGQDIQRRVEALRESDRPSNGTTYAALGDLADYGWVEDVADAKRVTEYGITPEGIDLIKGAYTEIREVALNNSAHETP